jgi:protein-tyrosine phosphatase
MRFTPQYTAEKGVLVHCAQGKSRSSSLVIAYFMNTKKLGFDSALVMVKAYRAMAEPNTGFEATIRGWTDRIHALDLDRDFPL